MTPMPTAAAAASAANVRASFRHAAIVGERPLPAAPAACPLPDPDAPPPSAPPWRWASAPTILGLLLAHLPIAQAFEWSLYDLRMRRTIAPAGAPKRIAIVEIDEQTLRALEPIAGRWPWPRLFHGGLIDFLARGPAAIVAYDVGFFEPDGRSGFDVGGDRWTGAESDAAFVESVQKAGNVVLLAEATYAGSATGKDAAVRRVAPIPGLRVDGALEERPIVRAPFEALAQRRARRGTQPVRARHRRAAAPDHAVPALRGPPRPVAGDGRLPGAGPRAARVGAAGRPHPHRGRRPAAAAVVRGAAAARRSRPRARAPRADPLPRTGRPGGRHADLPHLLVRRSARRRRTIS